MKKITRNWLLATVTVSMFLSSQGLRANDKDYHQSSDKAAAASEPAGAEKEKSADWKFIKEASKGGRAEVKMGELAQDKAQSPSVKQFGERLVKDHQEANQKLQQICESKGISKSDETDLGESQKMIDHLSSLSGEEFDKAFIDHAVSDHKKDVKKFEKEAKEGEDPAVRSFASETLPTLQEHLKLAQMLKDNPNASIPSVNEPAGTEKKSDSLNQGQEQKDQQDQKDQNQKDQDQSGQKP